MKVHKNLEKLLEDYTKEFIKWYDSPRDERAYYKFTNEYLSSNSLALGKPEPLVKNKLFEKLQQMDEDMLIALNETIKKIGKKRPTLKGRL